MPCCQCHETLPGVAHLTQNRPRNIGTSIRQCLLNLAREKSEAFDLVLTRYALERLLYRIGRSEWRTGFLLKGAMLYTLWYGAPYRPTRDMDLLAFGQSDIAHLMEAFRAFCEITVEDDGIEFSKDLACFRPVETFRASLMDSVQGEPGASQFSRDFSRFFGSAFGGVSQDLARALPT